MLAHAQALCQDTRRAFLFRLLFAPLVQSVYSQLVDGKQLKPSRSLDSALDSDFGSAADKLVDLDVPHCTTILLQE